MLTANNDAFVFFENVGGFVNAFSGNVFAANGSGIDFDLEGDTFEITHINGVAQNPNLVFGSVDLASGGTFTVAKSTGNFAFNLFGAYDWLPSGKTLTETLDYTITDVNGETSTATVTFTITGIDSNDRFDGTSGRDYFDGGLGDDTLFGYAGNDRLSGGMDNDVLDGGLGNDVLDGGAGYDLMTGGAGADVFDFNKVSDFTSHFFDDTIADFKHRTDKIDLKTIDANGLAAGNGAFHFNAKEGGVFTGVKGELVYARDSSHSFEKVTHVFADINGDKHADFEFVLLGLKVLSAKDFIL